MKRILLLTVAAGIAGLTSCNKAKVAKGTPDCVKDKITAFDEEITCEDGVKVDKYIFQDEEVYVFDPGNCGADMSSEVIDSDCNTLGYLGGITGNSTINGENFGNAQFQETIWEK